MTKILLPLLVVICFTANSQNVYRSRQTGFAGDPATWEVKSGNTFINATRTPVLSDDSIIIRTGHTVSVDARYEWDQVLVQTGATLRITQLLIVADGAGDDLVVNGNLLMESNSTLSAGSANATIKLNGNLTATTGNAGINAKINIAGSTPQTLTLAGILQTAVFNITGSAVTINLNGITSIDQLTMNSSGTVTVVGATRFLVRVLTLNSGRIIMDSNGYLDIQAPTTGAVIGGSATSFVEGPLRRNTGQAGVQNLFFPIGKGGLYRPVSLDVAAPAGGYSSYQAEIVNAAPNNRVLPSTLASVSSVRYARILNTGVQAPTSATVNLSYGPDDAVSNSSQLRIAKDDGAGNWVDLGGTGSANGTGSISSTLSFSTFNVFVLGTAKQAGVPGCATNVSPAAGSTYGSTTSVIFLWNGAANATAYDLYLWTGATPPSTPTSTNIPIPSAAATNLTAATLYNWYVVPKNAAGSAVGCISNKTSFTTAANTTLPCATNISPVNGSTLITQRSAVLKWNKSANASTWNVYLATGNGIPTGAPLTTTGDTSFYVTNLTPGTLYSWYVSPRDGIGGANTSCGATNKTTFTTAPATGGGNITPVANAGAPVTITLPQNSVTLDGSGSYDADGYIAQYYWYQVQGPVTATINGKYSAKPVIEGLDSAGVYVFGLQVKDNNTVPPGYSSVTVTVKPAVIAVPGCVSNSSPGDGAVFNSPTTALLQWNAAPGATSYDVYLWTGATPPVTPTFTDRSLPGTFVSNLIAGTLYNWYVVPKNGAGSAVGCIVNKTSFTTAPNTVLPCAVNASPVNGATLTTQRSARLRWRRSIGAYSWNVYLAVGNNTPSGPPLATVYGPDTTYYATGLTPGTLYSWYVVPRDVIGGENTSCGTSRTTFSTAAATAGGNIAPVANAGNPVSVILPTSTAQLDGTGSYDTDGRIAQYYWFQAQGPVNSIISNAFAVNPFVNVGTPGNYLFVLQVKDDQGVTAYSQVTVTVKASGAREMDTESLKTPVTSIAATQVLVPAVNPNPVRRGQEAILRMTTAKATTAFVSLVAADGHRVNSSKLNLLPGLNTNRIATAAMAQGLYIVTITVDSKSYNVKLLVE